MHFYPYIFRYLLIITSKAGCHFLKVQIITYLIMYFTTLVLDKMKLVFHICQYTSTIYIIHSIFLIMYNFRYSICTSEVDMTKRFLKMESFAVTRRLKPYFQSNNNTKRVLYFYILKTYFVRRRLLRQHRTSRNCQLYLYYRYLFSFQYIRNVSSQNVSKCTHININVYTYTQQL